MSVPVTESDHAGTGRAHLIDQYRGQHAIRGILGSLMSQVQLVEDAIFAMIQGRILDNAVDAQLDSVGDLVGEARQGRGDTEYREAIRLRIRVNRSQGKAEDVIQVADISSGGAFTYTEYYPAGFEVEAFNHVSPRALVGMVGQSRSAGTRGVVVSSDWDEADTFLFDGDSPGDVADPGLWDYTGDESVSSDRLTWAANTP